MSRALDGSHFRRVLGHYPTGVCVVTATGQDGAPVGMTVGSFLSVSLDPPLVAFLSVKGSRVLATVSEVGRFAVNVLGGDQLELCRRFASRDDDKFEAVGWAESPLGSPVLAEAAAWIDCTVDNVIELGDHVMVVGGVHDLDVERATAPLMFFQGGYGRFSTLSMVADTDDDLGAHLRLAELARPRLEEISSAFGVHAAASALIGRQVIQLAWVAADGMDLGTNLVGVRLPFVAPFGLTFAAWESYEVRDDWLGRVDPDEHVRGVLLESLAHTRRLGWAVIPDHATLREVEVSIAGIAVDGRLPASVRELEAQIEQYAHEFVALSEDRPRGVSVPVFDDAGRVVLALTAQRLPEMSSDRLDECRRALLAAADALTVAIGGVPPSGQPASRGS